MTKRNLNALLDVVLEPQDQQLLTRVPLDTLKKGTYYRIYSLNQEKSPANLHLNNLDYIAQRFTSRASNVPDDQILVLFLRCKRTGFWNAGVYDTIVYFQDPTDQEEVVESLNELILVAKKHSSKFESSDLLFALCDRKDEGIIKALNRKTYNTTNYF